MVAWRLLSKMGCVRHLRVVMVGSREWTITKQQLSTGEVGRLDMSW